MYEDEDNDGKFPDESPVEVRYPRSKQEEQSDRERWPWLPGTIVEQCGPDEWYVCIEVRELAVLRDGRRAPRAHRASRGRRPSPPSHPISLVRGMAPCSSTTTAAPGRGCGTTARPRTRRVARSLGVKTSRAARKKSCGGRGPGRLRNSSSSPARRTITYRCHATRTEPERPAVAYGFYPTMWGSRAAISLATTSLPMNSPLARPAGPRARRYSCGRGWQGYSGRCGARRGMPCR
jgi:hypothetical protein